MQLQHLYIRKCSVIVSSGVADHYSRHQKKALTFMMRREEGWQCDGSLNDIWTKEIDEAGQEM